MSKKNVEEKNVEAIFVEKKMSKATLIEEGNLDHIKCRKFQDVHRHLYSNTSLILTLIPNLLLTLTLTVTPNLILTLTLTLTPHHRSAPSRTTLTLTSHAHLHFHQQYIYFSLCQIK